MLWLAVVVVLSSLSIHAIQFGIEWDDKVKRKVCLVKSSSAMDVGIYNQ